MSEKANKCPHCGYVKVEEKKTMLCEECGKEIDVNSTVCPECGCPIEQSDVEEIKPQKVEVTNLKINKKSIKKIVIIVALIIVIALIGVFVSKQSKENAIAKAKEDYKTNLSAITIGMLNGAADSEDAGNLIKSVWYNTIYEESDSETDKYTKNEYGSFNADFNDSLQNLFDDTSFQSKINSIEENQESVKVLMKKMQNPPEEYEDAYDTLKDYYDAYLDLTGLVINPQGNLQTFSSNFQEADSELVKQYEAMQIYL